MRRKIISVIFISILITGSLSGCGKSGEDEISDSLESLQDTASSTNADDSTADGGIPNHLSYSVASNNGVSINVEADVISLGYQNAPIYEAEVIEVDDDLIAEYAEKLFDAASYDVIKPYSMFSEQELKDEQEFIYEQINSRKNRFGSDRFYYDLLRIESYIRNYDESNVSELAEGQLIYKSDSYSSAKLRGLIDGEQWELSYEAINGDEPQQSIKFYTCEDIDWSSSTVSMDDEAVDKYGENLSTLETSQKSAVNMLERLGYENMEVIHTGQQLYEDYNESWTDGYKFVFARSIGTMQIGFKDNSIVLGSSGFGMQQEYIHIYVNDNGVSMLTIDNIVEVGEMLSAGDQNSLMSFDEIDTIARESMKDDMLTHVENTEETPVSFDIDSVCLKYLVLPFEEGKYALMPVWLYYLEQSDEFSDNRFASICINAVDGSVIRTSTPATLLLE